MPKIALQTPLTPRTGRMLQVLEIDRISTLNQDPRSNEDQSAANHRWVEDRYDGPVEWTRISEQGSGEDLSREGVGQARDLVATRRFDLVIMEDVGRHLRRTQAFEFIEQCEDTGTRLIAINDGIDTAVDWRMLSLLSAMRHEHSNKDTSLRIKRTLRNRFVNGGALERRIFGYVDPPGGAKSDADRSKDPAAEPVYSEWFRKLEDGASYASIGDWLNAEGVPTGPYCQLSKWDARSVRRVTLNPILKGVRQHNIRHTKRVNNPGKYVSVKSNPEDVIVRHCPHLAFFDADHYDRVVRVANANNSKFVAGKNGYDPRLGRPKKKTKWPGQHIYCGVCGRLYRYGGHGQNDHLLCRGACEYNCWNGITVDGPEAARRISQAVFREIGGLPGFDAAFAERLRDELRGSRDRTAIKLREVDQALARTCRHLENTTASLRECGPSPTLLEELRRLETEKDFLLVDRNELLSTPQRTIEVPSVKEIKDLALGAFQDLTVDSDDFAVLIRRIIPRITAFPVRLIDGGKMVLRAWFVLDLVPSVPDAKHLPGLAQVLRKQVLVDLFTPPQREAFREEVMALKKAHGRKTERQIAAELGITQPAVQRAAALARKMDELGVTDPYQLVTEPPDDSGKLQRHEHLRYHFEPLPQIDLL